MDPEALEAALESANDSEELRERCLRRSALRSQCTSKSQGLNKLMLQSYPMASTWKTVKASALEIRALANEIVDLDKKIDALVQSERPKTLVQERTIQRHFSNEVDQLNAMVDQFEAQATNNEMTAQKEITNQQQLSGQSQQKATQPSSSATIPQTTSTFHHQDLLTIQQSMQEFMTIQMKQQQDSMSSVTKRLEELTVQQQEQRFPPLAQISTPVNGQQAAPPHRNPAQFLHPIVNEFDAPNNSGPSHFSSRYNAPTLSVDKLPKFTGDVKQFRGWWQLFEVAVDSYPAMYEIEKFWHLKQSLAGPAAAEIEHLDFTAEQYETATQILQDRFADIAGAERAHMQVISKLCYARDLHQPAKLSTFISTLDQPLLPPSSLLSRTRFSHAPCLSWPCPSELLSIWLCPLAVCVPLLALLSGRGISCAP